MTGEDWARLGSEVERVADFIENRAYMRMFEGRCAALELRGSPGGSIEYFCTVYEQRPQICRDLARGSPACAGERATKIGADALS